MRGIPSSDALSRSLSPGASGFGPFKLSRAQRSLLEDDRPVRLGSRALDLLIALIDRAGEIVSKQELMACVWPREVVEENTLRVHMAALRKALGDGLPQRRYITSFPGRGYCFVAPVVRLTQDAPLPAIPETKLGNLPGRGTRLVGRERAVAVLSQQLQQQRMVSIVGAGGMGKTAVALAVAEQLARTFEDGVCFVDLMALTAPGPVQTQEDVARIVAAHLGVDHAPDAAAAKVCQFLRDRELLLLLDSCEHVTAQVAPLIESLLQAAPRIRVLATSRETVRAAGEWVHLLPALEYPRTTLDCEDPYAFPAIQLFAERANASDSGFLLTSRDASIVVEICQKLDGLPLAIEMVAPMVRELGPADLRDRLDAQLFKLQGARRAHVTRHQTLKATFEWSYLLLNPVERTVLRRIAVFRGGVSMESALPVICDEMLQRSGAREAIANLVAKSWLQSDPGHDPVLLRLHGIAHAYARERLSEDSALSQVHMRHAEHMRAVVIQAQEDWLSLSKPTWLERYAHREQDVRAAIVWLMARPGALPQAVELISQACMFAYLCTQLAEYRLLVGDTLQRLSRETIDPLGEMRMHQALVMLNGLYLARDSQVSEHNERALELAARYGGLRELIDARMTQFIHAMGQGEHAEALSHAERLSALARDASDPVAILVADRMRAQGHHFMGEHERCEALGDRVLNHTFRRGRFASPSGPIDHHVSIQTVQVRMLWLQGRDEAARTLLADLLIQADADGPLSLGYAISLAALPLAWWSGDVDAASHLCDRLRLHAERQPSGKLWEPWLRAHQALLTCRGDEEACQALVRETQYSLVADHLITFDERCLDARIVERVHQRKVGWCAPEVLRAQAEQWMRAHPHGDCKSASKAESLLRKALDLARLQGAVAWERRASISLARLSGLGTLG